MSQPPYHVRVLSTKYMQLNIGKKNSLDTGKSLFAATSGASGLHLYRVSIRTSQQVYEHVIIISDCLHS